MIYIDQRNSTQLARFHLTLKPSGYEKQKTILKDASALQGGYPFIGLGVLAPGVSGGPLALSYDNRQRHAPLAGEAERPLGRIVPSVTRSFRAGEVTP